MKIYESTKYHNTEQDKTMRFCKSAITLTGSQHLMRSQGAAHYKAEHNRTKQNITVHRITGHTISLRAMSQ